MFNSLKITVFGGNNMTGVSDPHQIALLKVPTKDNINVAVTKYMREQNNLIWKNTLNKYERLQLTINKAPPYKGDNLLRLLEANSEAPPTKIHASFYIIQMHKNGNKYHKCTLLFYRKILYYYANINIYTKFELITLTTKKH